MCGSPICWLYCLQSRRRAGKDTDSRRKQTDPSGIASRGDHSDIYTSDQLLQGREEFKEMIEEQMKWSSVVVLGPGLGSEPYVEYLVEDILTGAYVPVILDADGLNTVASHPYLTSYYTENIIITPHLGEMARLTGQTSINVKELKDDLVGAANAYASRYGVTCVLKDALTVVNRVAMVFILILSYRAATWQKLVPVMCLPVRSPGF